MIAKILKSPYSGVAPGDTGTVIGNHGGGYTVRLQFKRTRLFGGATYEEPADMFFAKDEVEIEDPQVP